MKTLILGGARSGKSRHAERIAHSHTRNVVYLATARADDTEMQARINHHRADRPIHWQTIEEPLALADTLQKHDQLGRVILIDCLTLWISNLLCQADERRLRSETEALLTLLPQLSSDVIMVSNETGLGIIPMGELTRRFVDEAGRLHQQLAAQADHVIFMVAGLPQLLKGA